MSAPAYEASWSLEDVLHGQAGVIRPADVRAWLTRSDVRREVADGRWQRPHRGVYVAHNTALTDEQERWVCLLAGPPGAALAGLTAAELGGLEGFSVPEVHPLVGEPGRHPDVGDHDLGPMFDGAGDDTVVILRRGDDVEVAGKPKESADPLADE
jgi:hypothetical protein